MFNHAPPCTHLRTNELLQQNIRVAIPQYYEYINNRIIVEFKPRNDEDTTLESYSIELSKKSTYDQVCMESFQVDNVLAVPWLLTFDEKRP